MSNIKKSTVVTPISCIQFLKKKNENLIVNNLNFCNEEVKESGNNFGKTQNRRYNLRRNNTKESPNYDEVEDNRLGDMEYTLNIKKYLSEAILENEKLRQKIKVISDDNLELRNEIEMKNGVIEELAEQYLYCQKHHSAVYIENNKINEDDKLANFSNNMRTSTRNKKGSKSL